MTDLARDEIPDEAIGQGAFAARRVAHLGVDDALDVSAAVLTATVPLLQRQWEWELRGQIADEIDRVREDDYLQRQGSPLCEQRNHHDCHMAASQASLDWAARIARGGAS